MLNNLRKFSSKQLKCFTTLQPSFCNATSLTQETNCLLFQFSNLVSGSFEDVVLYEYFPFFAKILTFFFSASERGISEGASSAASSAQITMSSSPLVETGLQVQLTEALNELRAVKEDRDNLQKSRNHYNKTVRLK